MSFFYVVKKSWFLVVHFQFFLRNFDFCYCFSETKFLNFVHLNNFRSLAQIQLHEDPFFKGDDVPEKLKYAFPQFLYLQRAFKK